MAARRKPRDAVEQVPKCAGRGLVSCDSFPGDRGIRRGGCCTALNRAKAAPACLIWAMSIPSGTTVKDPRAAIDINSDKLAQLVDQPLSRKERHVVGLPCKAFDEVDAIPEVE